MYTSLELDIYEAQGRILVVMPNMDEASRLSNELRQMYGDEAHGSRYHLRLRNKEVWLISMRSEAMRGMEVDALFFHPQVLHHPDFQKVLYACAPCVRNST